MSSPAGSGSVCSTPPLDTACTSAIRRLRSRIGPVRQNLHSVSSPARRGPPAERDRRGFRTPRCPGGALWKGRGGHYAKRNVSPDPRPPVRRHRGRATTNDRRDPWACRHRQRGAGFAGLDVKSGDEFGPIRRLKASGEGPVARMARAVTRKTGPPCELWALPGLRKARFWAIPADRGLKFVPGAPRRP